MNASTHKEPSRIEPVRLLTSSEETVNLVTKVVRSATQLSESLQPRTARSLADLIRIMNSYYSNRIEGHRTRPREIEDALANRLEDDPVRRNLQLDAAAHVRLQAEIDRAAAESTLAEPAASSYIQWLHAEFYRDAPAELLLIRNGTQQ